MMRDAVVAFVGQAGVDAEAFEEPDRQRITGVMQHALIEGAMSLHRMRPQAVNLHDIVDGPVGPFDAIVKRTQIALGLLVFDVLDPHGGRPR